MTIGERIRTVRESKRMSQDELAKRMGYKDRSSVSKIEKGSDDTIYLNTVQNIADILECSPLYLMGMDKELKSEIKVENTEHISKPEIYYTDSAAQQIAQEIFDNKELRLLFDAAKDASPEDLLTVHTMLTALKKKEG